MDGVGDLVSLRENLRHGDGEPPQNLQRRQEVGCPQGGQELQGRSAGGQKVRQRQVRLARRLQDQGQGHHGTLRSDGRVQIVSSSSRGGGAQSQVNAQCVRSISGVREAIHSVAVNSTSESYATLAHVSLSNGSRSDLAASASRLNRIFARLQFLTNTFLAAGNA